MRLLPAFFIMLLLLLYTSSDAGQAQVPQYQSANPQYAEYPWNMLDQSRQLLFSGQPQNALLQAQKFLVVKPMEPEGYFWKAAAMDDLQMYSMAAQSYEQGIENVYKAGMDSAELRVNLGNDYLKLGKTDDAIVNYKRAIEIDPRLAVAYLNLARGLIQKGAAEEALNQLDKCDALKFNNLQLAYYRAKALMQLGKIAKAKTYVDLLMQDISVPETKEKLKVEFSDVFKTAT